MTTTIDNIIADINARLDALEIAIEELTGKKIAHEAESKAEPAQAQPEPSWEDDMAFIAEKAELAAKALTRLANAFAAGQFNETAANDTALSRHLAGRILPVVARRTSREVKGVEERLDLEQAAFSYKTFGVPSHERLQLIAEIARDCMSDMAETARAGARATGRLTTGRALAVNFNAAASEIAGLAEYLLVCREEKPRAAREQTA